MSGADEREGATSDPLRPVSRRQFLQVGGAGAVAAHRTAVGPTVGGVLDVIAGSPTAPVPPPSPTFTKVVRRRGDQLRLTFEFWNLKLDKSGPTARLVRVSATKDAYVVVRFLPQHVMEQSFYEDAQLAYQFPAPPGEPDPAGSEPLLAPPVGSRIAGSSRLAFLIPPSITSIPYTRTSLLAWDAWSLAVVQQARASAAIEPIRGPITWSKLTTPGPTRTALELPWWLMLSPHRQTGWVHAPGEVEHDGRVELWHTRMGGKPAGGDVDEDDEARMTVRAVWARDPKFSTWLNNPALPNPPDGEDFQPTHPIGMPFRTSLSPRDRYDLVVSSADFRHQRSEPGYTPLPAHVDQLMLSSMGAWLDLRGEWRAEPGTSTSGRSLQAWRHIATMGRDHYVRIVRSGFLFPIGHAASLIKVSERKFRTIGAGTRSNPKRRVAYMFQRYFIIVRQREVVYGGKFQDAEGRAFPFSRLRATTLITPTLNQPTGVAGFGATMAFVPKVDGAPFLFQTVGTDRALRSVDLAAPAVFVDGEIATKASAEMKTLRDWYNGVSPGGLGVTSSTRVVQVRGQKVATSTPTDLAAPGDTDLEVHRMTLGAEAPGSGTDAQLDAAKQPGYFPTMAEAQIRLAAAEIALGGGLGGSLPVVVLDPAWVENGFGAGPGEVFVRLKDQGNPKLLDFGGSANGDRAGGVITPNLGITALSRKTGTIGGDPDEFQTGTFNPADFFGSLDATLLGDITLEQVIVALGGPGQPPFDLAGDKVVKLITRELPNATVTELRWSPDLQDVGSLFVAELEGTAATLDLTATITTPRGDPSGSTSVVVGDLQHFTVALLDGAKFLEVRFDRLRFQAETGKKTDVDVEIREVVFAGALEFVNDLKDYLTYSSGGFSIELQPTQLQAGFELPLPSITLGIFALQNLTFAAGTTIPFTGKPIRFRFGFNTVDNPFLVSVMIFGGGGFFELAIGADGVESFQASLEFGVVAVLDFGVASGSISVTAGIYLAIGVENAPDNPEGEAELTGFIKLKGEVEVLGIISLGIFMKASFTYIPKPVNKAIVKAVIIVEVDVWPFSGEVEIEYEKKFGGSSDPTFGQSLSEQQWIEYTAAFAPIGA